MNPFNTRYYLVLAIPFNILLVYEKSFSKLEEAEDALEDRGVSSWFSIWDQEKYSSWDGEIVRIPLKAPEQDTFLLRVEFETRIPAESADRAHQNTRSQVKELFDPEVISTFILSSQEAINES